jgi:hypothetical protein
MCVTVAGAQRKRQAFLRGELYHMIINSQGLARVPLTLSEKSSIKQLRFFRVWSSTWGVFVLIVCNTSESSHHNLGAVVCCALSCTTYLRVKCVVQQFEVWRCLHQWADECNSDKSVFYFFKYYSRNQHTHLNTWSAYRLQIEEPSSGLWQKTMKIKLLSYFVYSPVLYTGYLK